MPRRVHLSECSRPVRPERRERRRLRWMTTCAASNGMVRAEVGNSITVQRKIVPRLALSPRIAIHNRYMCRSEQNQKCIGQTGAPTFGAAFIGEWDNSMRETCDAGRIMLMQHINTIQRHKFLPRPHLRISISGSGTENLSYD